MSIIGGPLPDLKKVGTSSIDSTVNYWYNPTDGNSQIKKQWISDDITDANRTFFNSLTASQRNEILDDNETPYNTLKFGKRATSKLKWELKEYERELSGENNTTLWENGFWNSDGYDSIDTTDLRDLYTNDIIDPVKNAANSSNGVTPWWSDPSSTINSLFASNNIDTNSIVSMGVNDLDLDFNFTKDLISNKLKNLKYPKDAIFDGSSLSGQDFISIRQFTYQPPASEMLFGGQDSVDIGLTKGFARKSATGLKESLGLVRLPMPNQIQDSNNVSWGPDQISNLTAAAAAAVLPRVKPENIQKLASGDFSELSKGFQNLLPETKNALQKIVSATQNNATTGAMAQGVIGSKILNMAGLDVSAESILARGSGIVPNNNLELLFNAPALREFQFNWKMSPRSREEAAEVNKIIKFFKAGMAVKKQSNTGSGNGASYFLGTPNIFDIKFKTTGNEEIDGIMRIKECACVSCAVNYTPESNWSAYEEGQPVSVIMTLKFSELEPVWDIDYLENKPQEYTDNTGIDDLPVNAIGY